MAMLIDLLRDAELLILAWRVIRILLEGPAEGRQIVEACSEGYIRNLHIAGKKFFGDFDPLQIQVIVEGISGLLFKESQEVILGETCEKSSLIGGYILGIVNIQVVQKCSDS